ncbi:MAG: response regulator transcription factor [Oscillospiraceae bacterium]|nr:response regulator transcription factor [Oscillospiraceae bacterium]
MSNSIITARVSGNLNEAFIKVFGRRKIKIFTCGELDEVIPFVSSEEYYLVVVNAEGLDLFTVQAFIREVRLKSFIPILVLADFEHVASILEDGADACIHCSADQFTILSHAMALGRRYAAYDDALRSQDIVRNIRRGNLALDPLRYRVTQSGQEISLTRQEYKLLHHFMENPGIVLTPEQICETIWGTEYDYNRDISSVVAKLRKKLCDNSVSPTYIQTVHGIGYRFLQS